MDKDRSVTKTECIKNLENLLNSKHCEDALNTFRQGSVKALLEEEALDLIPIVSKFITPQAERESPELIECCQEILEELAMSGNPKEMLVGLLEQAESSIEDFKFKAMLTPIQIVLQRLPGKRGKSLHWVLEVLNVRVKSLPVPKCYNLEKEERKLLDLDPDVVKITLLLSQLIKFYKPFVSEVSLKSLKSKERPVEDKLLNQRDVLTKSLLAFLDHPLAFICLDNKSGDAKSCLRVVSEEIVCFIAQLQSNLMNLFKYVAIVPKSASNNEKSGVSSVAIASFCYLVYAEGIEIHHWPQVFCHEFLLEMCLPVINCILTNRHNFAKHKGLLLGASFLARMPAKQLDTETLDYPDHRIFAQNMINMMIYCNIQEFRILAVNTLQEYISKFNFPARYELMKRLLITNKHPGVQGLLIQSIKSNIIETMAQKPPERCFLGENLDTILSLIVPLVDGPATDLLDQSDRIMATLNFLRFLALADDCDVNATGFWNKITFVENELLNPLLSALDLSRAHYQLKLKSPQETELVIDEASEVTVGGLRLAEMPREQFLQVMHAALNTFDMMEGVLARVVEIINLAKVKGPHAVLN